MKHIDFKPSPMVCTKQISFDLDESNKIHNLVFLGGCNGNLKAIAKLCEGQDVKEIAKILEGNTCGMRPTSCADQLSKALVEAINA